ncbi:MAG TPA: DUF992 domain-containing protein [Xanthobacteraceae bacterium]|nr:DUF992 domain-containing protein [Xanthobacteraceae bacterium]
MLRMGKLLAVATLVLATGGTAMAQQSVAAGTLTCDVSAGIGLIIGSRKSVACTFAPSYPGPVEYYNGTISKFGVDLGATAASVMVWLVYAPTSRPVGALAGQYVGATGEATVGVGLGANVLIGGSNRTVTLQPVSIQGQTGLNVAGGVAELALQFSR